MTNLFHSAVLLAFAAVMPIAGFSASDYDGRFGATEKIRWSPQAFSSGVWSVNAEGIMSSTKDKAIWSEADYENFILQFEYKLDPGGNSGVIVYATNTVKWVPGSIEIQLLDDDAPKWSWVPPNQRNSSLCGHLSPVCNPAKPAGEWNAMTIKAMGQRVEVFLNGVKTVDADLSQWTDARKNPDGTVPPEWFSIPWATIPTKGKIGFQGMHGKLGSYFRNVVIRKATQKNR